MRLRVELLLLLLPLLATIDATAANTTSTAAVGVAAAAKRVELLGQDRCISLSLSPFLFFGVHWLAIGVAAGEGERKREKGRQ